MDLKGPQNSFKFEQSSERKLAFPNSLALTKSCNFMRIYI